MPKFIVTWTKTYVASGGCEIEAANGQIAKVKMSEIIGDQEGTMQYFPRRNSIHATRMREEKIE